MVKILFVGDIVGRPGRMVLKKFLPQVMQSEMIDFVIANGENAAGGFGINLEVSQEILGAGVDVITLGNHTWDNREVTAVLERESRVIRPINYPDETPGMGYIITTAANGMKIGVISVLGLVFLEPLFCPFRAVEDCLAYIKKKTDVIIVDVHAEATSEKMALGWYLDGKVSAVIGTHTHIVTADERILPQGTGYITDAGMTGPTNSILGVDSQLVIQKFLTKRPVRFEVAAGPAALSGVVLEVNEAGQTVQIKRVWAST